MEKFWQITGKWYSNVQLVVCQSLEQLGEYTNTRQIIEYEQLVKSESAKEPADKLMIRQPLTMWLTKLS